jgi:hypothetical protein
MKKYLLIIFIFTGLNLSAQDLDIYKVKNNANFDLPNVPKGMTYEEFKILSTNLRMQDMAIAVILPGHAHFKIGETKRGYYILGVRSVGYAAWGYLALNNQSLTTVILQDQLDYDDSISTTDVIVAYTSVVLMVGSYLYDWIHAKYMLDNKQNRIRYKYAKRKVQVGVSSMQFNQKYYPSLALTYNF